MNDSKKRYTLDPDQSLDFQLARWKKSYAGWQKYFNHWTAIKNTLNEKLKDPCLPEMQVTNIKNEIKKADNNISWAKVNMERNKNSLEYYGKTKQNNQSPFKSDAIAALTKGKQGKAGEDGGLGPIVKSKKCS